MSISEKALVDAAYEATSVDLFEARLLGEDFIDLGLLDLIDGLSLSATERAWLRLQGAARWALPDVGVAALAQLPVSRYPTKLWMVAKLWSELPQDGKTLAAEHASAFENDIALARAMTHWSRRDVDLQLRAQTLTTMLELSGVSQPIGEGFRHDIARLKRENTGAPGTRHASSLRLVEFVQPGTSLLSIDPIEVATLDVTLLDGVIEDGRFDPSWLALIPDAASRRYITARVDPIQLTDADVETLDHQSEKARRAFYQRDTKTLANLVPEPFASHYFELLKIVTNRSGAVNLDLVFPPQRPSAKDLLTLCSSPTKTGDQLIEVMQPNLIGDKSLWEIMHTAVPVGFLPQTPALQEHREFAEWWSLMDTRALLFESRWHEAIRAGRECLRVSSDEVVRDEAQNLIACALHYLGDDESAIAALENAIEGAYSEALLSNIGIVASQLKPELAAQYLAKLAREAPTVELRLAATVRIITMWQHTEAHQWASTSGDEVLPEVVKEPIRRVLVDNIAIDDFRSLAEFLSTRDALWLGSADLSASPHHATLEHRYWAAAARGPSDRVEVMSSPGSGTPPQWFDDEIQSFSTGLLDFVVHRLVENDDEADGPALLALKISDQVTQVDAEVNVRLVFAGTALLLDYMTQRHLWAAELLVQRVTAARVATRTLASEVSDGVKPLMHLTYKKLVLNACLNSIEELDNLIDTANAALDTFRRLRSEASLAHQEQTALAVAEAAASAHRRISALVEYTDPEELDLHRIVRERLAELREKEREARKLA